MKALTQIKTKNELIGEVIGLLQAPIQRVLGALQNKDAANAEEATDAPVAEETAPVAVAEEIAPVAEEAAPAVETSAPAADAASTDEAKPEA